MGTTASEKLKCCCSQSYCNPETEQVEVKSVSRAAIDKRDTEPQGTQEQANRSIIAAHFKESSAASLAKLVSSPSTAASRMKALEEAVSTAPRLLLKVVLSP